MQTACPKVWIQLVGSIFFDNNYYTTNASWSYVYIYIYIFIYIYMPACVCLCVCVCVHARKLLLFLLIYIWWSQAFASLIQMYSYLTSEVSGPGWNGCRGVRIINDHDRTGIEFKMSNKKIVSCEWSTMAGSRLGRKKKPTKMASCWRSFFFCFFVFLRSICASKLAKHITQYTSSVSKWI